MKKLSEMTDEEFHAQHQEWMKKAQEDRQARYDEMDLIIEKMDKQMQDEEKSK